jgi:DNA polymerase-3 subunit delta
MIVRPAESERFLARLPPDLIAILFYGPDQGLVRERAEKVITSIVPDLRDPFRIAEMDGAALGEDPGRLYGEAAALSMTGGRRVVRIRAASNALAKTFAPFLADAKSEALIVVEGGDLARDSSLREAFEEAPRAASIACYLDSPDMIAELLRSSLKSQGATIAPDALEEAVSLLGADRGTTRREVEKLLLYVHGRKSVTLDDVRAIMGDEAEARIEEVCDAAGEGAGASVDGGYFPNRHPAGRDGALPAPRSCKSTGRQRRDGGQHRPSRPPAHSFHAPAGFQDSAQELE